MAKNRYTDGEIQERFWGKVQKGPGCWTWLGWKNYSGYGYMSVRGKNTRAHRIAFELIYGPIPPGMVICHRCDNPWCVRPDHLFPGTQATNARDCVAKGRHVWGERCGQAKLPDSGVADVRLLLTRGKHTHAQIAAQFGVSEKTVQRVRSGGRLTVSEHQHFLACPPAVHPQDEKPAD